MAKPEMKLEVEISVSQPCDKYIVLMSDKIDDLVSEVNSAISLGFTVVGGICVERRPIVGLESYYYLQSMVMYSEAVNSNTNKKNESIACDKSLMCRIFGHKLFSKKKFIAENSNIFSNDFLVNGFKELIGCKRCDYEHYLR